jgi:cytochrome c oxidase cbb3-type subunit IV
MYKNVLQSIDNIAIWPVISFVIFFLFFICLLWWVFTTDKKFIETMKSLPLDRTTATNNQTELKNKTGVKS